jgi:hypothetical protein
VIEQTNPPGNRFYIGEVTIQGRGFAGAATVLLERSLFDAVQAKLTEQWSHRTKARQNPKRFSPDCFLMMPATA